MFGLYNYTWDAENHLKSANGVNYTYDGNLRRVEKSNGKLYWYSTRGQILEETDLSGNLISDYVYFAGKRVGRRDASGTVYSYVTDPLGTTKGIISSTLCYDADFYPFGGEKIHTNTCAQNYKFTGLERDAESGLDDTLYRKYSSNLGRWLSPDPVRGRISNPQSLNLYPYVTDSPTNHVDPSGRCGCDASDPYCGTCDPSDPSCNTFGQPSVEYGTVTINFFCPDNRGRCCGYYDYLQRKFSHSPPDVLYAKAAKRVCNSDYLGGCYSSCARFCLVEYSITNCDGKQNPSNRVFCREVTAHAACLSICAPIAALPSSITRVVDYPIDLTINVVIPFDCGFSSN